MAKIILYTDGGARGNPGPAGAGVVVTDESGRVLTEAKKFLGRATNNEAEWQAAALGYETLKKFFGQTKLKTLAIEHRLDSELVVKQLGGQYQIKEKRLWPFFMQIWNGRVADFPAVTFVHIPRAQNARADELANQAMDEE